MSNMYDLPETNMPELRDKALKVVKSRVFLWAAVFIVVVLVLVTSVFFAAFRYFPNQTQAFLQYMYPQPAQPVQNLQTASAPYTSNVAYEQAIMDVAQKASPSVVSIVISKNMPVYEQQYINPFGDMAPGFNIEIPQYVQKGTKLQEVGAGSGFIVSADGMVVTNKHVVSDNKADYTVLTNDGQKYTAKVLALDPVQDVAIIKIQPASSQGGSNKTFQPITLGDSSSIRIGQVAVAIGNALGQFSNTVSVGVVSGLQRTISASDQRGTMTETLEGIIQTDAAINEGNSGGPLLNLKGEVIGINTATAQGAQSIGFAQPINIAKKDIDQVLKTNKIVYPFLGVRYIAVNDNVKKEYKLSVDYGALVLKGDKGEVAVTADSAAAKAGIKENDVILEINGQKIDAKNPMSGIIQKYSAGDKITLRVLRDGKETNIDVTLGERTTSS